jgi:integrase/recombinase XerD
MKPLRQKMLDDLQLRNYCGQTIRAYLRCVASFAKHFGQSPDLVGGSHVREFPRVHSNGQDATPSPSPYRSS